MYYVKCIAKDNTIFVIMFVEPLFILCLFSIDFVDWHCFDRVIAANRAMKRRVFSHVDETK